MKHGDWATLWKHLATGDLMTSDDGTRAMVERWRRLARRLDEQPGSDPDPLLDFVLTRLDPGMTVLDIGAGVGRWTIPIAQKVASVTAMEPVPEMREILEERLARHGVTNVNIVDTPWLETEVEPHSAVVAVHSMYTSPDLVEFVRKMEATAKDRYLAMRVPAGDGIIGSLSELVRGEWHDSPNFIVGFNLLLEAGFHPRVLFEEQPVRVWNDPTVEDALARAKRHLHISDGSWDAQFRAVLESRLRRTGDGSYDWPDGMRSALCWWSADEA